MIAVGIPLDVENCDQVRVLEIQALRDAAELDVEVLLEQLERHFFAGVGEGVIDFAKTAAVDGPLDRVAIEGF